MEQSDLLLYRLALDHLTGGAPAPRFLPPVGRKGGALASGVTARLRGSQALDFFERLVHVVLPNQVCVCACTVHAVCVPACVCVCWGKGAVP